jgi:hypothetical protein
MVTRDYYYGLDAVQSGVVAVELERKRLAVSAPAASQTDKALLLNIQGARRQVSIDYCLSKP